MWLWLKIKLAPNGDHAENDTWMGKYGDFPSQKPEARPNATI